MKHWKRYIPSSLKREIRQGLRQLSDIKHGYTRRFADETNTESGFETFISIGQPIMLNETSENKLHNLRLAAKKIDNTCLLPDAIFSFWKLVGKPSAKKGYLPSRSIMDGELEPTIGGGLCQLSGLIYYLALRSGMIILERHPHSIDIYTDAERFTPLGSDATIAYGYKDLRFINTSDHSIRVRISVTETAITGSLESNGAMEPINIYFEYEQVEDMVTVKTFRDGAQGGLLLNTATYKKMEHR